MASKGGALKAAVKAVQVLLAVILAALCVLTVYVMGCNMRGKVASVFGVSIVRVVSGSMEPSIHEGDYIILKQTDPEDLRVGDVICFYSTDSAIYGKPNTHRIVSVLDDGSFVTKGDANSVSDSAVVSPEKIIGRYDGKAGFLRWINSFASARKLILLAATVLLAAAAFYEVRTIAKITLEYREQQKEAEKQRLIREAIEREKKKLYEQGAFIEAEEREEREADNS
ncbi:MAG: signal peptidase I [Oscillospiraceae bacterium]